MGVPEQLVLRHGASIKPARQPHDAAKLADGLKDHEIFIKPLGDPILGPGFMRVTTALPDDNAHVVQAMQKLL